MGYARSPTFPPRTLQGIVRRKPFAEAKRPQYTVPCPVSSTSSIYAPTTADQNKLPCNRETLIDGTIFQPGNGAACEAQLISIFWDYYSPQQNGRTGSQCWLQQALDLSNRSPALRLSLKALAIARIGWIHRDDPLVLNGRKLYSQALQAIQGALYDERTMWQDETLATGNVLALYEVENPS